MLMNRLLICGVVLCCTTLSFAKDRPSLLIADTNGQSAYNYRNLIRMAHDAGFRVYYKNLYDLLELSDISQYDAIFFMLSPRMIQMSSIHHLFSRFMCALPLNYPYSIPEHCWHLLRAFSKQNDKALAIILPSNMNYSEPVKQYVIRTIDRLGCFQNVCPKTKQSICDFVNIIARSDMTTGSLFGTSLISPQNKNLAANSDNSTTHKKTCNSKTGIPESLTTPINTTRYPQQVQQTFPIGLVVRDDVRNVTFLISKSSEFTFADIAEHIFKNPLNIVDRNELLRAAQETLSVFCTAHTTKQIPNEISYPHLSDMFSLATQQQKKEQIEAKQKRSWNRSLYRWMNNKSISFAWMDPYDFYAHEDAHNAIRQLVLAKEPGMNANSYTKRVELLALTRGIKLIYDAQFDALWFELIPEWYFSVHGLRTEQKEEYIARIKRLGTTLRAFFKRRKKRLPKLFLGMNLTSNFKTGPVSNPVQDVYGNSYTKIPSPFDITHFWKPELLEVFDTFIGTFQKEFPIDGICFDLEMYHAPEQTGMYTDLMDFSDKTWQTYCAYESDPKAHAITSVKKRIRYLQREKKFTHYFAVLEQASKELGKGIKNYMRKKHPNLLFCAYAPTLPHSWFYRGFLAGLSSQAEPILLATFNTDYISHYDWLAKHKIYCVHGGALMLDKLQRKKDFQLIPKLQRLHNFVWYNRPSRMIYEYNKEQLGSVWWGIEATPYNLKKTMTNIKSYHCA